MEAKMVAAYVGPLPAHFVRRKFRGQLQRNDVAIGKKVIVKTDLIVQIKIK
jgi:hypothetical protein